MRIDCKITSQIFSTRLLLCLFFIALSFGACFAQENEIQNIPPESYFGATINYRNYPQYSDFSRVVNGQNSISTFESRNGIDFGLSYEKQVKKNWYYELSIPYLRFTNDRNSTTEVITGGGGSMPVVINLLAGETIQNLDITARYEYGINGWRFYDKKITIAFGAAIQLLYSNTKVFPIPRATFATKQNIIGAGIQVNPKISYNISNKVKLDVKVTQELLTLVYSRNKIEDPSLTEKEGITSEFNSNGLDQHRAIGVGLRVRLE